MKNLKVLLSVFLFLPLFILFSSLSFASFEDVSSSDPYYEATNYLKKNGVVRGYDYGDLQYFKPNNEINRAEFLKIVIEAKYDDISGNNCYPDVKEEWFAPYICKATDLGIVNGYDDGYFRPADNINFVEASKIIANTFALSVSDTDDEWFKPYVISLEEKNAIPESIGSFSKNLKRADMAEIIYRLMANVTDSYSTSYGLIKATNEYKKSLDEESLNSLTYFLQKKLNDPKYTGILSKLAKKYDIKIDSLESPDGVDSQTAEEIKILASVFMDADYNDPIVGPMRDYIYHASYKDVYFFLYSFDKKLFMTDKIDADTFELMGVYDYCVDLHEDVLKEMDEKNKKEWCKSYYDYIDIGTAPYGPTVLAKDKNYVYQISKNSLSILEGLDSDKFLKNSDGPADIYLADEKDVYYSADNELVLLEGADAGTFKFFLGLFFKDKNNVYYFDEGNTAFGNTDDDSMYKIEYADPKTFKFLYLEGLYSFFGDAEDVFVAGRYDTVVFSIQGVNPDSAKIYSFTEKKFIPLNNGEAINPYAEFPEIHPFDIIISGETTYLFNVTGSKKIDNLDAETFEVLDVSSILPDRSLVQDKNGAYLLEGLEITKLEDGDLEMPYEEFLKKYPPSSDEQL